MSCEGRVARIDTNSELKMLLEVLEVRREWLKERENKLGKWMSRDAHLNELSIVIGIINTLIDEEDE